MDTLMSAGLFNLVPRSFTFLYRLPATPLIPFIFSLNFIVVAELEHAGSNRDLPAHNDALSHTLHIILLALNGRVVEVISCHFEGGKHQYGVLHFLDSEASDAQNLSLVGHLVGEERHVTIIYLDSVVVHCHLDLLDDLGAGGFDAQDLGSLHDVVRHSVLRVDTWSAHNLSQAIAFDGQAVLLLLGVLRDDGTLDLGVTLDDDVR